MNSLGNKGNWRPLLYLGVRLTLQAFRRVGSLAAVKPGHHVVRAPQKTSPPHDAYWVFGPGTIDSGWRLVDDE